MIEDIIKHAISEANEEHDFESKIEACQALEKFLDHKRDFREGDYVVRREGADRYRFPKANQAAKCIKIFDEMQYTEEDSWDAIIVVAINKKTFKEFTVNSRWYEKA